MGAPDSPLPPTIGGLVLGGWLAAWGAGALPAWVGGLQQPAMVGLFLPRAELPQQVRSQPLLPWLGFTSQALADSSFSLGAVTLGVRFTPSLSALAAWTRPLPVVEEASPLQAPKAG